jgi:hypothetical protein
MEKRLQMLKKMQSEKRPDAVIPTAAAPAAAGPSSSPRRDDSGWAISPRRDGPGSPRRKKAAAKRPAPVEVDEESREGDEEDQDEDHEAHPYVFRGGTFSLFG